MTAEQELKAYKKAYLVAQARIKAFANDVLQKTGDMQKYELMRDTMQIPMSGFEISLLSDGVIPPK